MTEERTGRAIGRLANKRCVVTGGASGLGLGIATRFIEEGASVLIMEIDEPTSIDLSIAPAYSGSMCFELVQQNKDVPSVYKDHIAQSGLGAFHDWGVCTETFDEDLAAYKRKDMPVAFAGNVRAVGGLRFAYIDAMATARGMIELIECAPVVEDLFNSIKEQAEAWDGKTVFIRP